MQKLLYLKKGRIFIMNIADMKKDGFGSIC